MNFGFVFPGGAPQEAIEGAAVTMIVRPWEDAGATSWIESMWTAKDPEKWRERTRQGPPFL